MHLNPITLLALLIFGFAFVAQAQAQVPQTKYVYTHRKVLVGPDVYVMNWNYTKSFVTFELQVKTNGWIAFGITKSGGMNGADVMVAWVGNDGKVVFTDRHIVDRNVIIDKEQNWYLISGQKANGYTSIIFMRDIKSCDPNNEDIDIEEGTPKVIFAWDTTVPTTDISYHGSNRGLATVPIISELNQNIVFSPQDNIKTFDFKVNATMPDGWVTYYHCEMFKLPTELIQKKHHLVRTLTNIPAGNEPYVHHWLLYQCDQRLETEFLVNNSVPVGGFCFDDAFVNSANPKGTWNRVQQYCSVVNGIWAVGGPLVQDFPMDTGFPYGGANREFTYFYLQMHYSNHDLVKGVKDTTSLTLYFTENLRKKEVGVLTVGANSDWSALLIPPRQPAFGFNFSSRADCLGNVNDNGDITVFAVAPHTHLTGIQVYTKLIRNGKEIAFVDKALNYDFDYQSINYLQTPIVIKKGDQLVTTCVYKTTDKTGFTFGGIGTPEEMCLDFLFYYPKSQKLSASVSAFSGSNWVNLFLDLNRTGDIRISQFPPSPDGQSILNDIKTSLKTTDYVIKRLTDFYKNANQTQLCVGKDFFKMADYPQLQAQPLIEQSICFINSATILVAEKLLMIIIASYFLLFH